MPLTNHALLSAILSSLSTVILGIYAKSVVILAQNGNTIGSNPLASLP
jgi:hypothetical protein